MGSRRHSPNGRAARLGCWAVALWAVAASACDHGRAGSSSDTCNLSRGHLIALVHETHYDSVALLSSSTHALAAWSTAQGTFTRLLAPDGQPQAKASRVGERCRGGVALSSTASGDVLGCVRPDVGAYAVALDARGAARREEYLAPAGRDSQGVSLSPLGEHWVMAFHDGTPGAYAVSLVRAGAEGPSPALRISDPSFAAGAPSVRVDRGHVHAAWAETRFIEGTDSSTRLMLKTDSSQPRELGVTAEAHPDPQLATSGSRGWLGFRGKNPGDRKTQLYALRLADAGRAQQAPVRIGRANTDTPISLLDCGTHRFANMSRVYGGETFIAMHPLDDQLRSLGGGYQYYANSHDFLNVASACQGDGMIFLAAERTRDPGRGARLMAATLQCPD